MSSPGWWAITVDGKRIGTVMKTMGEPPKTRWVAFGPNERKQGFPTRKAAIAALEQWHRETGETAAT